MGKSYLLKLTDKSTRFKIERKITSKEAVTVLDEMEKISALTAFKTVSSDNGTEFAPHGNIEKITGAAFPSLMHTHIGNLY